LARKILLADDSVTAQNMGRKILTDAGYEVVTVNNGSAALKKIAEQKPDLIVLDVYMPGYSGLEVCQRIKEARETSRIPVLLTVGKLEPFKPEEARRARADSYIVKPFEASELLVALTKLEDKIVPKAEPHKPGRFAKAIAAVEESATGEQFGDAESGWKDRLSMPSATPKQVEPEADPEIPPAGRKGFRDLFRFDRPKRPAAGFERPIPEGLPQDITPEEIAAITAAAAKVNAAEQAPSEAPQDSVSESKASIESAQEEVGAESSAKIETSATDSPEIAQERAEATVDTRLAASAPDNVDARPTASTEASKGEDLPSATLASAPELATEEPKSAAAASPDAVAQEIEAGTKPEADARPKAQEQPETAPAAPEPGHPRVLPPDSVSAVPDTDAEVLAALQTLVPTNGSGSAEPTAPASASGLGSEEKVLALAAVSMAETSRGPRWIAEPVALDPDEAALSLEKEMEKAFAAFAAADGARASLAGAPNNSAQESVVATVASAREQAETMAAAPVFASDTAVSSSLTPAEPPPPEAAVPASKPEESVAPQAEVSEPQPAVEKANMQEASAYSPIVTHSAVAPSEPANIAVAQSDAGDAASGGSAEPGATSMSEASTTPVSSELAPTLSSGQPTDGGQDEMDREEEAEQAATHAAAWANWHQIRESVVGATSKVADETAAAMKEIRKSTEIQKDESAPPEAMAAAASAGNSSSSTPATDSTAIASIVDSVLAELKPKLVEEIARKMAGEKKKE
jgi:CheY-like chemotaxis protein